MATIPTGREEEAIREAYSDVMDGFAAALTRPGLPAREVRRLRRCYRVAARWAGRRPLDVVRPFPDPEENH